MPYDSTKDPYLKGGELTPNRASTTVVTSDTVDFALYPKSVTVLTAGTVNALPLKNVDGANVAFGSLAIGFTLPFRVRRINATGTTAVLTASYD